MARYYVNIYIHDKDFGGREEGGWWYDTWEPATEMFRIKPYDNEPVTEPINYWSPDIPLSVVVDNKHKAEWLKDLMEIWCKEKNSDRNSDIHSVISEGRYEVLIERHKPKFKPETKPHYE